MATDNRRGQPRDRVKAALLLLSGNQCYFPSCNEPLYAGGSVVGEIAHIHSPAPGGPRYRADLTDGEVHALDNLVLLCRKHHKIVDEQEQTYTADWLRSIKAKHEEEGPEVSLTIVLQELIRVLSPAVPEEWRDRPGAPEFRLGLASNRSAGFWTLESDVRQVAGTPIGGLKGQWRHGQLETDLERLRMRTELHWHLPPFHVPPDDRPLEIELQFWWDGAQRTWIRHWDAPEKFQTADFADRYT